MQGKRALTPRTSNTQASHDTKEHNHESTHGTPQDARLSLLESIPTKNALAVYFVLRMYVRSPSSSPVFWITWIPHIGRTLRHTSEKQQK